MKKINFPLEMAKGKMVRELEELQEYFDLECAVEYFNNGKLQKWLENTYNDDILEEIEALTGEEPDFIERFTEALGVAYDKEQIDIKDMMNRASLKEKLKRILPEERIEEILDFCADDQKKMEELIQAGNEKIYLVSGTYKIPKQAKKITFIGIQEPKVQIEEKDKKRFLHQELQFQDVVPEDKESEALLAFDETKAQFLEFLNLMEEQLKRI